MNRVCWLLPLSLLLACGDDSAPIDDTSTSSTTGAPSEETLGSTSATASNPTTTADATTTRGSTTSSEDSTSSGSSTTEDESSSGSSSSSTGMEVLPPPEGHATALCVFEDGRTALASSEASTLGGGRAAVRLFDVDGEELWATGYGDPDLAMFLHEIDCASDGSVYGVGLQGENGTLSNPRAVILRLNAATGDIVWDDIQPQVPSTTAYGLHAAASGLYVAGSAGLSRYTPDGDEVWTLDDAPNGISSLSDVLLQEGIVYAVGSGPSDNGILVRISEDGNILGSESFTWADDVWAEMVVANPGGGVVVVGRLDPGSFASDDIWIVTCDAKSCSADCIEVENEDTLHGFAVDARGQWIINVDDDLVAMSPDGTENWTYATDFPGLYSSDHRKMLAIDGNGTILVAGGDPFDLRRITADELPPE